MKNIYMSQSGIRYPNGTYLPYAAGTIAAYSLADPAIRQSFRLKEIFFMREDPQEIVQSLESPAVFAFSCYVWNTEYNKEVARQVKLRYPDCLIVFGGHNIPEDSDAFLQANAYVDIAIFGEGEKPFKGVLESILGRVRPEDVDNIAFRRGGDVIRTARSKDCDLSAYPSPYAMGLFDSVLEKYPQISFSAILETNRGCPYRCAFCDWCEQKSGVRPMSWERIQTDVRWMAQHGIEFCYCSDANFGLMKRDDAIIDLVIDSKEACGYPKKFRVNFAKNNNDTVFRITQKLEKSGLNKGATISFQSMTPQALKSIGRENMPIERFTELMELYRNAGISTYTEIILGLPEESYEDFCRGIGRLLAAGQHTTLFIYNCEVIQNSLMASPAFIRKYGIQTAQTELYVRHNLLLEDKIPEHSTSVVATGKMDVDDWVKANLFSVLVQSCHSMGFLRFFALYLYHEKAVAYDDFYRALQKFAADNPDTVLGTLYREFGAQFYAIAQGHGRWSCVVPEAGKVSWPYEEAFYIKLLLRKEQFYAQTLAFLRTFPIEPAVFADLLSYQKAVIKEPGAQTAEVNLTYDLVPYFSELMSCKTADLRKRCSRVCLRDTETPASMEEFAKRCVWFGRSEQKNLFSEITAEYGEAL